MDGKYLPNANRIDAFFSLDELDYFECFWRELAQIAGSTKQAFKGGTENIHYNGFRVALIYTEEIPFGTGESETLIVLEVSKGFLLQHYDELSEDLKELFPRKELT